MLVVMVGMTGMPSLAKVGTKASMVEGVFDTDHATMEAVVVGFCETINAQTGSSSACGCS